MRTTIEISDRHRSALFSLAAQRGLRGYSGIIEEALDFYIANQDILIAAICITHDLPLLTRNTEHFTRISRLKLFHSPENERK